MENEMNIILLFLYIKIKQYFRWLLLRMYYVSLLFSTYHHTTVQGRQNGFRLCLAVHNKYSRNIC